MYHSAVPVDIEVGPLPPVGPSLSPVTGPETLHLSLLSDVSNPDTPSPRFQKERT